MSYANSPQVIAAVTELFQQNKKNKKKKPNTHIQRQNKSAQKYSNIQQEDIFLDSTYLEQMTHPYEDIL